MSNIYSTSDLYDFLGKTLSTRIPKSIVIVVQLDMTQNMGYVIGFYGINLSRYNKLISILGINPIGKHFDITEDGQKYYYSDKTFRKFNGSIYDFAGGQLPEWVAKSVGKLYGIQSIYTIALNHANKPMGTALVFNRQEFPQDVNDLEVFVDDVSKQLYAVINDNIRNMNGPGVKDVFIKSMLNNLSHEIRTPLNGIMGLLQLVQNENDSATAVDASVFRDAWSNARTLSRSVDSLVLASELASETILLNLKMFSIHKIVVEVELLLDKLRSHHPNRKILFNVTCDESKFVHLDILRFKYIVDELVTNALKFSDDQIEIELNGDSFFSLHVKDYGIGLTEMELNVIFEHFAKVSYSNKMYRGMGLGLYNTNQLATLFGGSLKMTSVYDTGSTVMLDLPFMK